MTNEQIDVFIAEKIGWTPEPCTGRFVSADYVGSGRQLCITCGAKYTYPGPMVHNSLPPPPYSTDMNAAMEALKNACLGYSYHLVSRGKLIQELFMLPQGLDILNAHYAMGMVCAWTPEMICKAILRAYGVEIEQ